MSALNIDQLLQRHDLSLLTAAAPIATLRGATGIGCIKCTAFFVSTIDQDGKYADVIGVSNLTSETPTIHPHQLDYGTPCLVCVEYTNLSCSHCGDVISANCACSVCERTVACP